MNVKQMQVEFGIQMNQLNEPLALQSADILYWLNKAQEHFVIHRYNGMNPYGRAFEQSQQLIDDLKPLFKKDVQIDTEYIGAHTSSINGFYADAAVFPNDLLFLISTRASVYYNYKGIDFTVAGNPPKRSTSNHTGTRVVSARFSQSDDIFRLLEDPFNTTKVTSPITDVSKSGLTFYTNNKFLVDKAIISYIMVPKTLVLSAPVSGQTNTSELPVHTHKEIIQLAVDLFLQNTRELKQRLQRETPTADSQQNIEENE